MSGSTPITSTSPLPRRRVAVVYHFLPNYRQGVFDAMADHPDWDITFFTGHTRPGQEGVPEAVGLDPLEVTNRWLAGRFLWQQGLLKQLRQGDFDAVVFLGNWMWATNWLASIDLRRRDKGVLYWTHGWIEEEAGLQGILRRRFYRLADKLLLYGKRARDIGRGYGWVDEDLVVVGNSLPLPDPTAARNIDVAGWTPPSFANPDLPTAVWISRLIAEKNPSMVIDAAVEAERRGRPINVVFIGGGDEDGALRADAARRAPGRIDFTGPIHDDNELAAIFAAANVTVVPDYGGLSIPHSLIHGVPVVANADPEANGPDYEYLYPETNGSVFPRGDVDRFTDEILRWAYDEPIDETRTAAIVEQARTDASPTLGAARIFDAIEAVLATKSGLGDDRASGR